MTWAATRWGSSPTAGAAFGPADPLSHLSDDFSTGSTLTGNGWYIEDTSPTCTPSDSITGGEGIFTVAAGAAGGSFWYDTNDGALWWKPITGAFDFRMRVRVTDSAGTGLPPVTNFRIAGIAAHDPDRATYEYVHIGLGSDNTASLREEWKTTDNSDSAFAYVDATLTGGELLYDLRIVRRATDTQIFDLYVRAGTTYLLRSDTGWTLRQTVDRSDDTVPNRIANGGTVAVALPDTLRVGPMVYASVASHDIRMYGIDCLVQSTTD